LTQPFTKETTMSITHTVSSAFLPRDISRNLSQHPQQRNGVVVAGLFAHNDRVVCVFDDVRHNG
jgi:hypothetical protein